MQVNIHVKLVVSPGKLVMLTNLRDEIRGYSFILTYLDIFLGFCFFTWDIILSCIFNIEV